MAKKTIGLDIGSKTITIYQEGKGIVVDESNRIAIDVNTKEPVSYGTEAILTARRTPGSITLTNPVFEGNIADPDGVEMVLEEMFRQAGIVRPEVVLALGSAASETDRNALAEMLYNLGARNVEYIAAPTACVLGSDQKLSDSRALISVNIGAGVTDIGLVKGCVTRFEQAVKYGCNKLDAAVSALIKKEFSVQADEDTLADIRVKVGSVHPESDSGSFEFRGRDLITGLPVAAAITSAQTRAAMSPIADYICKVTLALFKSLPDKIAEEVASRGLLISGGGALTAGMDRLLAETTGLPVTVSPNATGCIIEGIGVAIENRKAFGVLIKEL